MLTTWTRSWKPLVDLIEPNRVEYCARHSYRFCSQEEPEGPFQEVCRRKFAKAKLLLHTNGGWVWVTDADGMFTNLTLIAPAYLYDSADMLVSEDCHGANFGSFLVRNTQRGLAALKDVMVNGIGSSDHQLFLRLARVASTRMLPQKVTNSYDYGLYTDAKPLEGFAHLSTAGQWSKGDLFVHWPGRTLEQRMEHYRQYEREVLR